jgi:hypothetical protein
MTKQQSKDGRFLAVMVISFPVLLGLLALWTLQILWQTTSERLSRRRAAYSGSVAHTPSRAFYGISPPDLIFALCALP